MSAMIISFLYQRLVTNDHDNHESILTALYTYAKFKTWDDTYSLFLLLTKNGVTNWGWILETEIPPRPGQR